MTFGLFLLSRITASLHISSQYHITHELINTCNISTCRYLRFKIIKLRFFSDECVIFLFGCMKDGFVPVCEQDAGKDVSLQHCGKGRCVLQIAISVVSKLRTCWTLHGDGDVAFGTNTTFVTI